MRLLIPGRHHLLTRFQRDYLHRVLTAPAGVTDAEGAALGPESAVDTIIWAITSANHAGTRRNPLPANRREVAIEHFAAELPGDSFVYLIDDLGQTERFAEYILKKIEVDSFGRHRLSPADTLVASSTPEVAALFARLGYRILPVEASDLSGGEYLAETPWQLLCQLIEAGLAGQSWQSHPVFVDKVAAATRQLYTKYGYDESMLELYRQPATGEDGDLTDTRDYNVYVRSFDQGAKRKYELVKDYILPGRIVDIGCCTGSILRELSYEDRLRESDLYGIEVARRLYAECLHRKEQGAFGNENVFFYHRDFAAGPIFPDNSVNTFLTFALTHEIESYLGREALTRFAELLHAQLAIGGRWINVDVVGPPDKDDTILLWLNDTDGETGDPQQDLAAADREGLRASLSGLSTYGRFLRFARDFRREEGERLAYDLVDRGEGRFARLSLEHACEFLSKKDYLDNWQSEMHERFCFFDFDQWQTFAAQVGFHIHPASHPLRNPWIVQNRWEGRVRLYRDAPHLEPLDYPVTNLVLVAEKR